MKFLLLLSLVFALILESSITTLPLVFVVLLIFTLIYKKSSIFLFAFLFGIIFDILSFRTIGLSGIFLSVILFFVLIYQSKFEIATNNFVLISSFLGSLGFLIFLGYNNNVILQAAVSSFLGLVLFKLLKSLAK